MITHNKPTFDSTVSILVKAYLNDTLAHDFCTACAVGNIIAASLKIRVHKDEGYYDWDSFCKPKWGRLFLTDSYAGTQRINVNDLSDGEVMRQIYATGYKWQELAKIEFAFETASKGNSEDEWMFNGLMAVVDVLAEIHGVDLKTKEEAKLLFVKQ